MQKFNNLITAISLLIISLSACEVNFITSNEPELKPSASPSASAKPNIMASTEPEPIASVTPPVSMPPLAIGTFVQAESCPDAGFNNLVENGSFESPDAGSLYMMPPNPFGGWEIVAGSVDVVGGFWQAAVGKQSLDLSGGSAGTIEQTVSALNAGQPHRMVLCLAGNTEGGSKIKELEVLWNSRNLGKLSFDTTGKSVQNMGWVSHSIVLPGNLINASNRLTLRSLNDDFYGPAIDGVSIYEIISP